MPEASPYARMGKLSAIIFILPSAMGGGWLAGHYLLDSWLTPSPWGGIAGVTLGAIAGFYEIFQLLTKDAARDRHN